MPTGISLLSSGNATVPSNAPIQPPQAFVNNVVPFYNLQSGAVSLPDTTVPVTFVDPGAYYTVLNNLVNTGNSAYSYFNYQALPTSNIDSLLSLVSGFSNTYTDFRGPNMGVPTPADVYPNWQPSPYITQIVNNNGTVFVQEYVNRFVSETPSGETETVGYSN